MKLKTKNVAIKSLQSQRRVVLQELANASGVLSRLSRQLHERSIDALNEPSIKRLNAGIIRVGGQATDVDRLLSEIRIIEGVISDLEPES